MHAVVMATATNGSDNAGTAGTAESSLYEAWRVFFLKTRDPDLEHSSEPLGDYCV